MNPSIHALGMAAVQQGMMLVGAKPTCIPAHAFMRP